MPAPEAIDLVEVTGPLLRSAPEMEAPVQEALPETSQGYTYIRADGTVEHAATVQEAMKHCSVLGEMSLEQANVMLELAAIGKAKLAQETARHTEPRSKQEETSETHSKRPSHNDIPERKEVTVHKEVNVAIHPQPEAMVARTARDEIAHLDTNTIPIVDIEVAVNEGKHRLSKADTVPTVDTHREVREAQAHTLPEVIKEPGSANPKKISPAELVAQTPPTNTKIEVQTVHTFVAEPEVAPIQRAAADLDVGMPAKLNTAIEVSPATAPTPEHKPLPINESVVAPIETATNPAEISRHFDVPATVDLPEMEAVQALSFESLPIVDQAAEPEIPTVEDYPAGTEALVLLETSENTMQEVDEPEIVGHSIEGTSALPALPADIEPEASPKALELEPESEPMLEPEAVFQNFTKTLEALVAPAPANVLDDAAAFNREAPVQEADAEEAIIHEVPPAVTRVVEKLTQLAAEEKDVILPVVIEISALTRELQSLEEQDAPAIAAIEDKLEELCITLFEQLNIDYTEEDVQLFMQVVTRAEFIQLQTTPLSAPDLEHEGTREAKRAATSLSSILAEEEHFLRQMLGRFTLLYSQFKAAPFPSALMSGTISD